MARIWSGGQARSAGRNLSRGKATYVGSCDPAIQPGGLSKWQLQGAWQVSRNLPRLVGSEASKEQRSEKEGTCAWGQGSNQNWATWPGILCPRLRRKQDCSCTRWKTEREPITSWALISTRLGIGQVNDHHLGFTGGGLRIREAKLLASI